MRTAILAGATGLIGSQLLELLLTDKRYDQVIAISRRPLINSNSKLNNLVIDFSALTVETNKLVGDDVFCCLGTTMRQAGSREAFRKVDFEYPVSLATLTRNNKARQFLLVTAMGANKNSGIFYNRVKGEVEESIKQCGFESLHIFRPSLLLGPRTEKRSGEGLGKMVMTSFDFMIPKKYKAIESVKVARAMLAFAEKDQPGTCIHESGEMQSF